MDMYNRGWTSIAVSVAAPSITNPKGGTYNRLEKRLKYRKQSWDEVVAELLDIADKHPELVTDGK
jgi:hypothetical protein